jgi:hypothetical protein
MELCQNLIGRFKKNPNSYAHIKQPEIQLLIQCLQNAIRLRSSLYPENGQPPVFSLTTLSGGGVTLSAEISLEI